MASFCCSPGVSTNADNCSDELHLSIVYKFNIKHRLSCRFEFYECFLVVVVFVVVVVVLFVVVTHVLLRAPP